MEEKKSGMRTERLPLNSLGGCHECDIISNWVSLDGVELDECEVGGHVSGEVTMIGFGAILN